MGEQADGFELEFVQERENVGELPVTRVPLGWSVSPSCAAKVRRDHAVVLGKLWDDLAPLPPVLCDFVEQHERLAPASLGHMHAKPWKLDKAVLERRIRESTAALRSNQRQREDARKNWFVLFGEELPA